MRPPPASGGSVHAARAGQDDPAGTGLCTAAFPARRRLALPVPPPAQ